MILLIVQMCIGALCGAVTVLGLMMVFLALCIVMRAIGYVLSYDFEKVLKRPR
jgi:hypothetical protein